MTSFPSLRHDGFLVETDWLAAHLDHPALRLFDCTAGLTAEAFAGGHIPGARRIDLQKDFSDPASPYGYTLPPLADFAAALGRAGIGPDNDVILYSQGSYGWATRLWWMRRHIGFARAAVLNGSQAQWTAEGRPLETGPDTPPVPVDFPVPVRDAGLFVDQAAVLAAVGSPAACIVNALSAEQHSGAAESKYGRRGHIRSSLNVPFATLIDPADNRFRPAEALAETFRAAGVLDKPRVITYCGGGIAATVDAFALLRAGHGNVAVYDASLAEWATKPDLPMDVGLA